MRRGRKWMRRKRGIREFWENGIWGGEKEGWLAWKEGGRV
jgi:hypothetical protein